MGSCYVGYEMENMIVWLVVVWHENWMLVGKRVSRETLGDGG